MTWLISKYLIQTCYKSIKNDIKTLVFTTLDIWQLKKIGDYENIYSVNPLFLTIAHASGYIEEKGVNKYLAFNSTDENKELLKKYSDVLNKIINKMKKIAVMNVIMKKIT